MIRENKKRIVIENLKRGLTVQQACINAGIAEKSHYLIYKKDPHYREEVEKAKMCLATIASDALYNKIKDGRSTIADDLAVLRIKAKGEWAVKEAEQGALQVIIQTYGDKDPLLVEAIRKQMPIRKIGEMEPIKKETS